MNYNTKKHQLLGLLSKQHAMVQLSKPGFDALGISYNNIYLKLSIIDVELVVLTSELYDNGEIEYYNHFDVEGICTTNKGIAAFSNEKYKKLNSKFLIEKIKDLVQIIIPVLSLIVAIAALTIKLDSINNENKVRFDKIERQLKLIVSKQKD